MPHIHEKVDFTAEVFIVHKNKVLLRKHDKLKFWLSIGGHIELDEDPTQAAVREAKEEVGLDVKLVGEVKTFTDGTTALLAPRFLNRHHINDTHEHITFVYFATTESDNINQGTTEISDEIRWFTREDLENPQYELRDNVKFYAEEALGALAK